MRFRSSEAALATGGRLHGPDVWIEGASFDSRSLQPGSLFVPIVAARDGHDHIADAFSAGAAASLTSRPVGPRDLSAGNTMIEVDDTAAALMALGRWARSRRPDRVVGITGSVGKTSTKDLLAAALASTLRTAASPRSFNNEQGLPVTILDSPDDTEVMVLEMGIRGLGELDGRDRGSARRPPAGRGARRPARDRSGGGVRGPLRRDARGEPDPRPRTARAR